MLNLVWLDFNGVSLSGGDILVNPDLDLAHELKGWWDSEGCRQEMSSITVAGARGGDGGSQGPAKIIGEVKQDNLGYGEKGDYYNTMATVTFFRLVLLSLSIKNFLTVRFIIPARTRRCTRRVARTWGTGRSATRR